MPENQNLTIGLNGFVMGAIVGAGVALLLAPARGDETRRRLMDSTRDLGENARRGLDQVKGRVEQMKGHVAEGISTAKQEIRTSTNRLE
jgi:gas vesicle protein